MSVKPIFLLWFLLLLVRLALTIFSSPSSVVTMGTWTGFPPERRLSSCSVDVLDSAIIAKTANNNKSVSADMV